MKQSTCYLYEYENNKQVRNLGFVKYIQEEEKVAFQIHCKGLNCSKNEQLEMYLFASKEEKCFVSRAGFVETEQNSIHYMVTVDGLKEVDFQAYDGLYLQVNHEKKYVAMWNQKSINFDHIETYNANVVEEVLYEEGDSCNILEETYDVEPCKCELMDSPEVHCNEPIDCEGFNEEMECDSVIDPCPYETDYVINDCLCEEEIEEVICRPCEEDFEEEEECNSDIAYEKIERQDIAKLPQREWKLANNSFLLHGYHNYQHILFIQEAGRSFLGVPGIYAPREADAAKNFGFPVFHRVGRKEMTWEEGERDYNVDFGYWCREVSYHKSGL